MRNFLILTTKLFEYITIFSLQILIFAKSAQTAVSLFYFTAAVWLKKPRRRRLTAAVYASGAREKKSGNDDKLYFINLLHEEMCSRSRVR